MTHTAKAKELLGTAQAGTVTTKQITAAGLHRGVLKKLYISEREVHLHGVLGPLSRGNKSSLTEKKSTS